MPKAEVGSTKYLANKMKAKGLQRLRWYCQTCQKQCRDENGFKQHTQSEGHVRAMLLVGEDPRKHIEGYSRDFLKDFLQLLKTSHGEKKVHLNNFYQEYIRDKEHIHMNSTKWPSLTEFAKYLGREGICRVEEGDKGLEISFVDDSPEAVRRREDVKRKEREKKGDEEVEARLLEAQVRKAREEAERSRRVQEEKAPEADHDDAEVSTEPVKVSLSLGGAKQQPQKQPQEDRPEDAPLEITTFSSTYAASAPEGKDASNGTEDTSAKQSEPSQPPKMSMSLGGNKAKTNPLMAKKNPLSGKKDKVVAEPEKKMSNAERIMREEMERKRKAEERGANGFKKQRLG